MWVSDNTTWTSSDSQTSKAWGVNICVPSAIISQNNPVLWRVKKNEHTKFLYNHVTRQRNRKIWGIKKIPYRNVLHIHVTSMGIRQHGRDILKLTNKWSIKVLDIHVTSVSIRQQIREILRNTNRPYTKVLNIHVTSVSIRQQHKQRKHSLFQ